MSSLSTGTTSGTAAVITADTTGDLILKTGSSATTAVTVSGSTQAVTLAGSLVLGSSTLAAPSGSAPSYTCRAWVNFNGTGTPAIRASGNVSSITDNGTGDYTVNFTTAMSDVDYASVITYGTSRTSTAGGSNALNPETTYALSSSSALRFFLGFSDSPYNFQDTTYLTVAIFR